MASTSMDEPSSAITSINTSATSTERTPDNEKDGRGGEAAVIVDSDEDEDLDSDEEDEQTPRTRHHLRRVNTLSKSYTSAEERTILRKLDRRLVLFIALLYLLSFLDRSNIGNARIAGLESSLQLTSSQYSWLLTAFYITYIAFEWMILLYRVLPAHIYISVCVLSWGVVACLQGLTTSFPQLLTLRALLGITEAAFGPGVPFYLSFFYRRSELAYRVGMQIAAAPLATSFASSLAWVIVSLAQRYPVVDPWRALFLVEGFPSVLVGVAAWWIIPDGPGSVSYLTARERKVAVLRLAGEKDKSHQTRPGSKSSGAGGINITDLLATLTDPKCYLTALMFFSVNVAFSSLPVFLPTVLTSMSFSPLASQALAAPPYLFAFVFVLLISRYSDAHPGSRGACITAVSLLSAASYAAIAAAGLAHERLGEAGTVTIRYVGVFGAAMGFFSAVTLIITWTLNNQRSETGKGVGMTILNVVGQCGPLVGVRLFPSEEGPYFVKGMSVCAGFMGGVAVLAGGLRWYLSWLNQRGAVGEAEYEMVGIKGDEAGDEREEGQEVEHALMGGEGRRRPARSRRREEFSFML